MPTLHVIRVTRMRAIRLIRKKSVLQVARKTGINGATVSAIERLRTNPTPEELAKIRAALRWKNPDDDLLEVIDYQFYTSDPDSTSDASIALRAARGEFKTKG